MIEEILLRQYHVGIIYQVEESFYRVSQGLGLPDERLSPLETSKLFKLIETNREDEQMGGQIPTI